jgi:PelA/Pel-15E family pectate lyase
MLYINIMELYNEQKKYSHNNINELLAEDITCSFTIIIFSDIQNNFKLIDKGERGELFVILNKNNKIIFYYGNKIKKQLESSVLENNKIYHISFVRSLNTGNNYLYINGKVDTVSSIININGLEITTNKIKFLNGGNDYKMSRVKLFNYPMSIKQIQLNYLCDTKNKSGLLRFIGNRLDELMDVNIGIFSGFLLDDVLLLFTKCQIFFSQKNYPLDTYIKYNLEKHEFDIPSIINILVLKTTDINDKFNIEDMAHKLITWQVGMYESIYPKNINTNIDGYWIDKEVSPFVTFIGNGLTFVTADGKLVENKGTFQSGMFVSFIKIIIEQFFKTKNTDLLLSIHKTIDYLIYISSEYDNGGVPLYFPKLDDENWKYNISFKNGNYINYLRTIEFLLNSDNLLQYIDNKINSLKNAYKKSLNLLLKLQINVNDKKTIWSQYYDKNTLLPMGGNNNEPMGLCSLESAQILLYLMDFETPTNNIKNAIISGCEWFKNYKITGWIQVFEKKSFDLSKPDIMTESQTLLLRYNYLPFPNDMFMHSRYYDFENLKPIFQEDDNLYNLESFNDMSVEHRNDEYHIGMWGHYLLETYEEWRKLHNI